MHLSGTGFKAVVLGRVFCNFSLLHMFPSGRSTVGSILSSVPSSFPRTTHRSIFLPGSSARSVSHYPLLRLMAAEARGEDPAASLQGLSQAPFSSSGHEEGSHCHTDVVSSTNTGTNLISASSHALAPGI